MTCSVIIRPATPSDVPELAELIGERDRFYGVARTDPAAAAIADALFGPVPAGRALVAVLDGAVAGLAAYSFLWPAAGVTRSLYLKELFVRATARRHGIGGGGIAGAGHAPGGSASGPR